jgi:phospholipase C
MLASVPRSVATSVAREGALPGPRITPIEHVVIVFQENHSFDNVLGRFCHEEAATARRQPCDGAMSGTLPDGKVIPLRRAEQVVPPIRHTVAAQQEAIDGGRMDGFANLDRCGPHTRPPYQCYSQYDRTQIPNTFALAARFAVSDRTFEFRSTPSWGGHMVLASASLDGFVGDNPSSLRVTSSPRGDEDRGWGCDSHLDAVWFDGRTYRREPSCVPDLDGNGPYRPSPVPYVPTIFDRLEQRDRTWKVYAGRGRMGRFDYGWAICPTFYECLGSSQRGNLVPAADVLADAANGSLPSYAIVTPLFRDSQHNGAAMTKGDNWIGEVIGAIENGPDWSSTVVFLTWDDCGCFYDHVNPSTYDPSWGIREPMIVISPYARPGFTDSHPATLLSMLAFTEHTFDLTPLGGDDGNAYDYRDAFDYSQDALPPVRMIRTAVPPSVERYIRLHPPDPSDPT